MIMPRHIHVLYDLLVEIIMNPFEVVFFFLRFFRSISLLSFMLQIAKNALYIWSYSDP